MDSHLSSFMYLLIVTSRLWLAASTAALSAGYWQDTGQWTHIWVRGLLGLCPILGQHKTRFVKCCCPRPKLCCGCATCLTLPATNFLKSSEPSNDTHLVLHHRGRAVSNPGILGLNAT